MFPLRFCIATFAFAQHASAHIVRKVARAKSDLAPNDGPAVGLVNPGGDDLISSSPQSTMCAKRPAPRRLPASLDDALQQPIIDGTDCLQKAYADGHWNRGTCCCSFWTAPAASLKNVKDLMHLSDPPILSEKSKSLSCVSSYPEYSFQPTKSDAATCGDFAIGVSGQLKSGGLARALEITGILVRSLQEAGKTVDVFMHVSGHPSLAAPGNQSLPEWVKGIEFEKVDAKAAEQQCTGGVVDEMFTAMDKRYNGLRDVAGLSHLSMHRKIFLAYRMASKFATEASCKYKYYIRTRPDLLLKEDFGSIFAKSASALLQTPVFVGAAAGLHKARSQGAPPMEHCAVDDQIAFGEFTSMGAYTTLFPDYTEFVRYVPLHRWDFKSHTSEQLLTAHLHYRNATFDTFGIDLEREHDCLTASGLKPCGWVKKAVEG